MPVEVRACHLYSIALGVFFSKDGKVSERLFIAFASMTSETQFTGYATPGNELPFCVQLRVYFVTRAAVTCDHSSGYVVSEYVTGAGLGLRSARYVGHEAGFCSAVLRPCGRAPRPCTVPYRGADRGEKVQPIGDWSVGQAIDSSAKRSCSRAPGAAQDAP